MIEHRKWVPKRKIPRLNFRCRLLLYTITLILAALSLVHVAGKILPYFAGIIIYVLAACSLFFSCYYLMGDMKYGMQERLKPGIKANPITRRMAEDYRYRTFVFAVPGLILNLIFAVFNGVLGFASHSAWFGTLSAYYILLSVMRFHTVRCNLTASKMERTKEIMMKEIHVYRDCGILFIFMTIALIGTVVLLLHAKGGKHYPGVAIFAVAAYTFYKTIISIINLIKAGKLKAPLLMAIRDIGYIDACVSILSLQTAMFASFGQGQRGFKKLMDGITGFAVCLMVLVRGIRCIRISLQMKRELS